MAVIVFLFSAAIERAVATEFLNQIDSLASSRVAVIGMSFELVTAANTAKIIIERTNDGDG